MKGEVRLSLLYIYLPHFFIWVFLSLLYMSFSLI
nr:MAG TPA: hypothetical protein [Bacteriophage sp.]